jgi:N-acetylglucosamine-6-phosphate deacetylase
MKLGVDAALVAGRMIPGDVVVEAGRIGEIGVPAAGSGLIATVGFVDVQVNGYAGVDFSTGDVAGFRRAGEAMLAAGVTTFQATFITLPWDAYPGAIAVATEAQVMTPGMVGIHLEGPFISPQRCGAHDPANIVDPTPDRLAALSRHDVVTWTTIAPEVAGGLEAIRAFFEAGKTVAVGHSNAAAATAHAAFEAGATSVTHLFNAQSPMGHRAPGIPGVALDDERVWLTLIIDGHHLAPEIVRLVYARAPERSVLITDAIAATGLGDGTTELGDRTVTVSEGEARLEDGTLAGSVLTMDQAVRNLVELGIPLEHVLASATANPARAIGGSIPADLVPGAVADVTVLTRDLEVARVLRGGVVAYER